MYASPRHIEDPSQCYFYHTMDLPGVGTVTGEWDLRGGLDRYLGGVSFTGKRVLDIGCASGVLSFYMESKGAEVVSFDLDKTGDMDLVPYARWNEYQTVMRGHKAFVDRLNNGYWLAHRLMESNAKVAYGNVYAIPEAIGPVDVCVFGACLLHLRDPFLALHNGLRITTRTVIVTDLLPRRSRREALFGFLSNASRRAPFLRFLPDPVSTEPKDGWWEFCRNG